MSDVGNGFDVLDSTFVFDDDVATNLPDETQLIGGIYRPTNFGDGDTFPAPAPPVSGATALSTFNGVDPAGPWRLYVMDDEATDGGAFELGWEIFIDGFGFYDNQLAAISIPEAGGEASPYASTIRIPNDSVQEAGAVTILRGSPQGVSTEGAQWLHQNVPGVEDAAEPNDEFSGVM